MRLADFILSNIEPILANWEAFARTITPAAKMDPLALRDHAADILRATAKDMTSAQTDSQRRDKAEGAGAAAESVGLNTASDVHAIGRVDSGFQLVEVVAEYRALRASVIRLWLKDARQAGPLDLDDLTRFNESIDQALTSAVATYTRRVDTSRRMFLAILGHDLRGPLNAMTMSAALLQRTTSLDPDSIETASLIASSAHAMARMIGDILDFTAGTLGSLMPVHPARADLTPLCHEVLDETRAAHPQRDIRFTPHGNLTGQWDADRLRQALANLLGNAVQHGDDPIELTAAGSHPDHVTLSVRNAGSPIPSDLLPTLFDPLVRDSSDQSQQPRRHGSIGLGLYIARQIVIAHAGTLTVTSPPTGPTTFTATLPRHAPATHPQ